MNTMNRKGIRMESKHNNWEHSWFYRLIVNNKVTVTLLNILLLVLVIWMFHNMLWVFDPISQFVGAILPSLVLAGVLFYLLNPLVDLCERRFNIPRVWTISIIFILITGLLVWGIISLIPLLQEQIKQIISSWPKYWHNLEKGTNHLLNKPKFASVRGPIMDQVNQFSQQFSDYFKKNWTDWAGNISFALGTMTNIFVVLATAPFVLFFMLKDGKKFKTTLVKLAPIRFRATTASMLDEVNQSLSNYIRGQLTVAFWVAVMFCIGYTIVGQNYALTLGVLAGILNLIPYLGSPLAMVPALIIAAFTSGMMVIKVIIVFLIEQTIESRVVSPLVVGSKMEMHPVTTILLFIALGSMFGLPGMIFGIPVYAVVKIIFTRLFKWFKDVSGLYDEDEVALPPVSSITPDTKNIDDAK